MVLSSNALSGCEDSSFVRWDRTQQPLRVFQEGWPPPRHATRLSCLAATKPWWWAMSSPRHSGAFARRLCAGQSTSHPGRTPPTAPNCRRLSAKRACSELHMNIKLEVSCNATALIGARGAAPVDLREAAISQSRVVYRRAAFILLLLSAPLGGPARAATPPDTVVMGKGIDDIVSLDPAEVYEVSGAEVVGNVYDRLIEGDPRDPAQIRAGLATAWSVDSSGRVFTFKLRRDTRFATGAPVTAGDAAFSLQRAIALDKAPALVLRQLGFTRDNVAARVRAVDEGTLVIETTRVLAPSLVYFCLTAPVASIVERNEALAHELEGDLGNGWLAGHSAGSGPYRLRLWRPAERYVLDANPDYWGGTPANRHVFVRHIKEAATQRLMLLRGDIDYARDLDKDQLEAIAGNPAIRFDRGVQSLVTYLALNQRNPFLRHPEVVAAIKHLIDYDGTAHAITTSSWVNGERTTRTRTAIPRPSPSTRTIPTRRRKRRRPGVIPGPIRR